MLEMINITKRFPGVTANDRIDFKVLKGEIHALVGENGAGKSTLMSILYGLYTPDEGEIFLSGTKVHIDNPTTAINLGIGMVHQHFMLVEPMTVTENIVLGQELRKNRYFMDTKSARLKVEELSKQYGLNVDPNAKIMDISVGMQQRVEILKVLYRGAEILVLDEPTAVLTPQEIRELYSVLLSLKRMGKTIIFITHKLNEVMDISDRVTVLRSGKVMGTIETSRTSPEELARLMVGREVLLKVEKSKVRKGKAILEIKGLETVDNRNLPALRGVFLEVMEGEVLGIAGVEGNGQTELVEVLTGLRKATSGEIYFMGKNITNLNPREIKELKIAHIPEDRQKKGLILNYSVADNLILGYHYKPPFTVGFRRNLKNVKKVSEQLISEFDIRTPDSETMVGSLSGGNQQKTVVAREFYGDPVMLVASQPTRGVDIGAIEFIHRRILELRDRGKGVLLVSAELQEIMALSDRIAVIYNGRIVGTLAAEEANEDIIGLMMTGVSADEALGVTQDG
jgi:simple sugar transport system ATP-binding protein